MNPKIFSGMTRDEIWEMARLAFAFLGWIPVLIVGAIVFFWLDQKGIGLGILALGLIWFFILLEED